MSKKSKTNQDKISYSNNQGIVKELIFTSEIAKEIQSMDKLMTILDKLGPIDFVSVYHQDDSKVMYVINKLRAQLKEADNSEKEELRNKLLRFEPSMQIKNTIVVKRLLLIANEVNYKLGVINDTTHIYTGAYWERIPAEIVSTFLAIAATKCGYNKFQADNANTKKSLLNQLLEEAKLSQPKYSEDRVAINLLNGTFIYEKSRGCRLEEFNSRDLFTYQIKFAYDPLAEAPKFQSFLDKVMPDKNAQLVMSEYVGYIFAKHLKLEKCLVLVGIGHNGKSVFGDIVSALLGGTQNVAGFSLKNLCDTQGYYRAKMKDFLLCYSSELSTKGCDPDLVKQIISNEPVNARSVYKEPFTITNYCRFMFNTNLMPKEVEQSHGYMRRFMFLKFDVQIKESEANPNLAKEIIDECASGILNWIIVGLMSLLKNEKFTYCEKIDNATKQFAKESNSVALFIDEENYQKSTTYINSVDLYKEYVEYTQNCGYHAVSRIEFLRRLKDNLGISVMRKQTGNATWVFVRKVVLTNGKESTYEAPPVFPLNSRKSDNPLENDFMSINPFDRMKK